jgi:hypothetical protein
MGIKVSNACLIFRDKDNNIAYIKSLSDEDLRKIKETVIITKNNSDKIINLDSRLTDLEIAERAGAVLYDRNQTLTALQKTQARSNIDAASATAFRQHTTDPSAHSDLFDQKVDNSHLTDANAHSEVFALYLPKTGGTISGDLDVTGNIEGTAKRAEQDADGNVISETYVKNTGGDIDGNLDITGDVTIGGKPAVKSVEGIYADAEGNIDLPDYVLQHEAQVIDAQHNFSKGVMISGVLVTIE